MEIRVALPHHDDGLQVAEYQPEALTGRVQGNLKMWLRDAWAVSGRLITIATHHALLHHLRRIIFRVDALLHLTLSGPNGRPEAADFVLGLRRCICLAIQDVLRRATRVAVVHCGSKAGRCQCVVAAARQPCRY